MEECATCQHLLDEWKSENATLRQMRRSALVWDYGSQVRIVEQKKGAYVGHRTEAHPEQHEDEPRMPRQFIPKRRNARILRRSVLRNVGMGAAVVGLILLVVLLHTV